MSMNESSVELAAAATMTTHCQFAQHYEMFIESSIFVDDMFVVLILIKINAEE